MGINDEVLRRILSTLDILTERFARLDERSKHISEKHDKLTSQIIKLDTEIIDQKDCLNKYANKLEQLVEETKDFDKFKEDLSTLHTETKQVKYTLGKILDIGLKIAMALLITYLTLKLNLSDKHENNKPTIQNSQGAD